MEFMKAAVETACVRGTEAVPVTIEVTVGEGMPGLALVGFAGDGERHAVREVVRSAMQAQGFCVPCAHITVAALPLALHAGGAEQALAVAAGILAATGQIPPSATEGRMFYGDVGPMGSCGAARGYVCVGALAARLGLTAVTGSKGAVGFVGSAVETIEGLADLREGGAGYAAPRPCALPGDKPVNLDGLLSPAWQDEVWRASEEGRHILVRSEDPDAARRVARFVAAAKEPRSEGALLEVAKAYSAAGRLEDLLSQGGARVVSADARALTIRRLLGGGRPVAPGLAALATSGALLIEGADAMTAGMLHSLRAVMEAGEVALVRADGTYRMPAAFTAVLAQRRCPCGRWGVRGSECTCSREAVRSYRGRLARALGERALLELDICE